MLRTLNWVGRGLGFAWVGVVTFVLIPPPGDVALAVQIVGYCLAGAAALAWVLMDTHPATARYRDRWLPVTLGIMAVAAGFACTAGGGGSLLVVFAFVAALGAGSDLGLAAALAVTAAGILAIEVGGLIFGDGYGGLLGLPAIVLAGLLIGRNRGAYRIQAEQSAALLAQRERLQAEQRRADLLEEPWTRLPQAPKARPASARSTAATG